MKGNTLRPDAQAFDEVRIFTTPRYKQSDLSGDEWRISATVEFLRNGVVKDTFRARNVETALTMASGEWLHACDDGKGYFASEGVYCDQEGCRAVATVFLHRSTHWCSGCGLSRPAIRPMLDNKVVIDIRQFCSKHATRGDCGLDDADRNYKVLK